MQDENPSQPGSQSTRGEIQADKEWSDFQRDLDTLGHQLAALQVHTAALGSHVVAALEARFQDMKTHATSFRQATEQQLEQARQAAWQQASETEGAFSEARARSSEAARDAARQMWERSEPLRKGAKDVGEGLVRAWSELSASFGKAAGRLRTEETADSRAAPSTTSDDRRETT
jgi:predicted  nucleic acid-binding Zn-ribbon protein